MAERRKYKGKYVDEELEEAFKDVKFFVEANSNEVMEFWSEFCEDSLQNKELTIAQKEDKTLLDWEQVSSGFHLQVGELKVLEENEDDGEEKVKIYPVCASVQFAILNDIKVCFYDPCSLVVHHEMVRNFFETLWPVTYDKGYRKAFTNSSNFHHCVGFVREERNKRFKLATHD